jgi:hypothetical protein
MGKNPIAVLIDGENLPASHVAAIMQKARELGDPIARCVVGDFTGDRLKAWVSLAQEHALELVFQQSGGKHKNSSDIALTIRAMDLLAEKHFERFLIVSSDCDFAPLALRLRRSGVPVYGMGASTPGSAWRAACTEFFELGRDEPPAKANGAAMATLASANKIPTPAKPVWSVEDRDAVGTILGRVASTDSPWIRLSRLGQHVRANSEPLARRLGKGRLLKNLRFDPLFCLQGKGQNIEVRLKASKPPTQAAAIFKAPRPSPAEAHPQA